MSITYTVDITDAAAHLVCVNLHVTNPDPAGQSLSLPNWIPGSYMIRDFSRNIVSIGAECNGSPVSLVKEDKSTWRAPPGLTELNIAYRVYAWDLSVRAAHVDRTHAFFNGTSLFLSVEGQAQNESHVRIVRPVHDEESHWRVATTLRSVSIDSDGFGLYKASTYDELIDHPVEMGTYKKVTFKVCGVIHEIVLTGTCHFDEMRLARDLSRICEYQIRFFGEPAPVEHYIFMVMVVDVGYGGLEHRASTALMITREHLPIPGQDAISDQYLEFLGLCSHEYFHTWNVKRIKPARFVPYELKSESYTQLLWFFEGMTSYYDDLVLVRSGLIDVDRYLGLLSKTLTRVQRGAGRLSQTVAESSFDAWHKFYKQDENSPNAIVSYYAKGALIALCLDAELRRETQGRSSLDTLMKLVWTKWLETEKGLAEDDPERVATDIAGKDLNDFFHRVLHTTEDLPTSEALTFLGAQLTWRPRRSSSDMGGTSSNGKAAEDDKPENVNSDTDLAEPWLGATIVEAAGGVRVTQVMRYGPAEYAGLAAGDVIVALNNMSVSIASLEKILRRYSDKQFITLHYFRLGYLNKSELPIEFAPADTADINIVDAKALEQWLVESQPDTVKSLQSA